MGSNLKNKKLASLKHLLSCINIPTKALKLIFSKNSFTKDIKLKIAVSSFTF